MHRIFPFLVSAFLNISAHAQSPLSISEARASQRSGTKLVDISYDITGGVPPYTVSIQGSSDSGVTWTLPVTALSGKVGGGISAGLNRTITWNAGTDWDGLVLETIRFRVYAMDSAAPAGFARIPAGWFTMGRTSGDTDSNAPPVNVHVSAFYMAKYEVTKALWDEVHQWGLNNGYFDMSGGVGQAPDHPVTGVSWLDTIKWCNARSERDGLTPVYTVDTNVMRTGTTAPMANWNANGYRLPTEAEWEKAARGGISGLRFPWGDTITHSRANYWSSNPYSYDTSPTRGYHPTYNTGSSPYTAPVGSFAPNGYGLFDAIGNVWEWCWDWYSDQTYTNGISDPRGVASGTGRVRRGGCWVSGTLNSRTAARSSFSPETNNSCAGFRSARSVVP